MAVIKLINAMQDSEVKVVSPIAGETFDLSGELPGTYQPERWWESVNRAPGNNPDSSMLRELN